MCRWAMSTTTSRRRTTSSARLAKHSHGSRAQLMQIQLDWAQRQFRGMGRRDAQDLAVDLLVGYQGSAVLTNALGQPELMSRQSRRLEKWIDSLEGNRHD